MKRSIIALELALGEPPNLRVPPLKAMFYITQQEAPRLPKAGNYSREFSEFIEQVLEKNPVKRASAEQALQLGFFKNRAKASVHRMIQNKKNIPLNDLIK